MGDVLPLSNASTYPRIAWDSVLDDADLTSTSSNEDDGALDQVKDWTPWTFWRPTGAGPHVIEAELDGTPTVNAWAIAGHDASGAIAMDTWDGAAWVEHSAVVAAGDGSVVYLVGDPVATAKLRWRFASISHLAILFAGSDLVLPEGVGPGWTDPVLALRAELTHEVSRDGVWLGAAIEQWRADLSLDLKHVEATWARTYWTPFLRACSARPFFLHWHRVDWPASACLCTGAKFGGSPFSANGFVDLSVSFTADPGLDRRLTPSDDAPALLTEPPGDGPLLLE